MMVLELEVTETRWWLSMRERHGNTCCDAGLFVSPVTGAYNRQSKLDVFTLVRYIAFDTLWLTSASLTVISRSLMPIFENVNYLNASGQFNEVHGNQTIVTSQAPVVESARTLISLTDSVSHILPPLEVLLSKSLLSHSLTRSLL
jgi:hypothetical protein